MDNSELENLALSLFDIDAVKFGDYQTKSGIRTPVYFDLRVIVSYPHVMELIAQLLHNIALKDSKYDHVCGVPYTALPIATLLSIMTKKSMLMRRKEAKSYGTKKAIEGHYTKDQICLIIEDVVTSGSSVMETVNDLKKEGLKVEEAVIILDREQGGKQNLEANNIKMKSLFTLTELCNILMKNNKITKQMGSIVNCYLADFEAPPPSPTIDRSVLSYEKRAELTSNIFAKQLFNIMATKKTNLCLSVDLTSSIKVLDLLEKVGQHVCLVKTHIDIIEDYSNNFITQLKDLAKKLDFLLLEDRKYADIGNTVAMQYTKGLYKVAEWAHCITAHSLPGEGILKALNVSNVDVCRGVFLLAEMSSEGNLITPEYTKETVKMAVKYPKLIAGFVCQHKDTFQDPGLIQLTPGVQLESSKDELGQVYNTPEKVVLENGADVIVVGRGIVAAESPEAAVVIYKDALWKCYLKRVSGKLE